MKIEGMETLDQVLQEKLKNIIKASTTNTLSTNQQERTSKSSSTQTLYECPKCKDVGFIIEGNIAKECECLEIKRCKARIEKSDIGKEYQNYNFTNFKTDGMHETIKTAKTMSAKYYKEFKNIKGDRHNSICFMSKNYIINKKEIKTGVGAGKTHLSIALANNIMKNYKTGVLYFPYRDVVTKFKQNMVDEEYYQKEIGKYKEAPVLLIDDLFKGKINETDINIMFEIINHRYLNCKPIIVSTEFDVNKLLEFDQATGSRIVEMCKNYLIEIGLSREEVLQSKTINYRLI